LLLVVIISLLLVHQYYFFKIRAQVLRVARIIGSRTS